jgi:hypothetical protein
MVIAKCIKCSKKKRFLPKDYANHVIIKDILIKKNINSMSRTG